MKAPRWPLLRPRGQENTWMRGALMGERTCSIDGCEKPVDCRGWCGMHWRRWRHHGDPNYVAIRPSDEKRFLARIDKRGPGECWPWVGGRTASGYGAFKSADGVQILAHRWSYLYFVGPIPEGLVIDHVAARGCTRRECVNPAHLEPVTQRENLLRADTFQARNAAKTHCPEGHEYTEANTSIHRGKRSCIECSSRRRRNGKGLDHNRLKTHCPQGHEYSTENTYVTPAGKRHCRTCRVEANRARRRKARAQD